MESSQLLNGDHNAMPLTEYSANPDPKDVKRSRASSTIPPAYLLPNGDPDVNLRAPYIHGDANEIAVSQIDPSLPSIRSG